MSPRGPRAARPRRRARRRGHRRLGPASPCCPRTPRPRPRSSSRAGCSCPSPGARRRAAARRGRHRAARRPHDDRAGRRRARRWRRPSARPRWSTGSRPARRSSWCGASSCSSTTGATTRRACCAAAGSAVRDLKAVTTLLAVDEATAALVVETCAGAGLLSSRADTSGDPVWVPTDAYDTWLDEPPAARWATLVRAWLDEPPAPAARRHPRPGGQDVERAGARAGVVLDGRVARRHPRRPGRPRRPAPCWPPPPGCRRWSSRSPGTARDGRARAPSRWPGRRPRPRPSASPGSTASRRTPAALVAGGDPEPGLAALLPDPVDHVLIQADLTAVAPGPLETALARSLQLLADVESRGGRDGLPVHAVVGAPRARRGVDRGRGARLPGLGVAHPGAAAADLPRRRHRAHLRLRARRRGRVVPARRRRGRAQRAAPPPPGPRARACAASPRP